MKKDSFVRLIIMLAALAAASYLAIHLTPMQNEITAERKNLSKAPIAGLHKFLADVAWMRFVNYAGGLSTIDTSNVDKVSAMLRKIISYDPNFLESYQSGILSISNADPKLAVQILENACANEHLKNNVQIPFYAGFILSRKIVDQNNPDKVLSEPDYAGATRFFRMAIQRSPNPEPYIISNYIRAKAKARGGNESNAVLSVLYDEWKMTKGKKGEIVEAEFCQIPDVEARMIKAMRDAKYPTDENGKPVAPSAEAKKLISTVQKEVFSDNHLCQNCISQTHPGDKFCSHCGVSVPVWGVCSCGVVLKDGATFCSVCGKKQ